MNIRLFKKIFCLLILYIVIVLNVFIISSFTAFSAECKNGNHEYAVTGTAATETQDGEMVYTCRICGYNYHRIFPALGHTWSPWIIDKQPTCGEQGHEYRTCLKHSNAPHTEEVKIPALGHEYEEKIETVPGCAAAGIMRYTCTYCGDTYTKPYGSVGAHIYVEKITKAATCTQAGASEYTCTYCGDTYTKPYGNSIGHNYVEETTIAATCTQEGEILYACSLCADTQKTAISETGHKFGNWVVDIKPTEKTRGHRYKLCEYDDSHIVEEEITVLKTEIVIETESMISNASISNSSTYALDISLILIALMLAIGFAVVIYPDLYVINWENKKAISYTDWLKINKHR